MKPPRPIFAAEGGAVFDQRTGLPREMTDHEAERLADDWTAAAAASAEAGEARIAAVYSRDALTLYRALRTARQQRRTAQPSKFLTLKGH